MKRIRLSSATKILLFYMRWILSAVFLVMWACQAGEYVLGSTQNLMRDTIAIALTGVGVVISWATHVIDLIWLE